MFLYPTPECEGKTDEIQLSEASKFLRCNGFSGFDIIAIHEGEKLPDPTDTDAKALGEIVEMMISEGKLQQSNPS